MQIQDSVDRWGRELLAQMRETRRMKVEREVAEESERQQKALWQELDTTMRIERNRVEDMILRGRQLYTSECALRLSPPLGGVCRGRACMYSAERDERGSGECEGAATKPCVRQTCNCCRGVCLCVCTQHNTQTNAADVVRKPPPSNSTALSGARAERETYDSKCAPHRPTHEGFSCTCIITHV
eukprot:GHVR01162629.1.p1 GENE.GHVR01162629.1~~GHVR01162629.1.p1  ORF type:complete len:184 (-),score=46.25 GHVR01162629.1:299-850(-)